MVKKELFSEAILRKKNSIIVLSLVGITSSVLTVLAVLQLGETFGYPGSTAYVTYETFNRYIALFIILQWLGIISFSNCYVQDFRPLARTMTYILLVAWPMMALGNASEFWLFSDLPYAQLNLRSVSFSLFILGSLSAGLSMLIMGLTLLRAQQLPRTFSILCLLILPLNIGLFVNGKSIFIVSTLGATLLSIMPLITMRR